jgi:hypothetical protein
MSLTEQAREAKSKRGRDRANQRKALGLCSRCEQPTEPDRTMCKAHLAKRAERNRKRKADGICSECANPTEPGRNRCTAHRLRRKEQIIESRAGGLCPTCHQPTIGPCIGCTSRRKVYFEDRFKRGLCRHCDNPRLDTITACLVHKEYQSQRNIEIRDQVLSAYGSRCSCCGESERAFLAIDHKNNDGHVDRKNGIRGQNLLKKIIALGFPEQYQVLCHNCNTAKSLLGTCPHQLKIA